MLVSDGPGQNPFQVVAGAGTSVPGENERDGNAEAFPSFTDF